MVVTTTKKLTGENLDTIFYFDAYKGQSCNRSTTTRAKTNNFLQRNAHHAFHSKQIRKRYRDGQKNVRNSENPEDEYWKQLSKIISVKLHPARRTFKEAKKKAWQNFILSINLSIEFPLLNEFWKNYEKPKENFVQTKSQCCNFFFTRFFA